MFYKNIFQTLHPSEPISYISRIYRFKNDIYWVIKYTKPITNG